MSYLYFGDDGLTVDVVEPVDAVVSNHFENGHDLNFGLAEVAEALKAVETAAYSLRPVVRFVGRGDKRLNWLHLHY